jgi:hypothetical protein
MAFPDLADRPFIANIYVRSQQAVAHRAHGRPAANPAENDAMMVADRCRKRQWANRSPPLDANSFG